MQKKLLKNLLLVLAITVLCFAVGMTASAEDRTVVDSGECGAQGDNVIWTLYDDGELVISGEGEMEEYTSSSDVPWRKHTEYGSAISIKRLTVEDGVNSISGTACWVCYDLTVIILPDSLNSIGSCAFSNSVYYNDSNNWDNGVLYIGNHLIEASKTLSGVYGIRDNTVSIAESAFLGCENLTDITIPDSVKYIGRSAFSGCNNLVDINIPKSVIKIEEGAFNTCYELKSINVASDNAFYLTDENGVLFNKDKTELLQYPNGKTDNEYIVPNGVKTICAGAFGGLLDLENIALPESIEIIGEEAFSCSPSLTSINLPSSIKRIDSFAFTYSMFIEEIYIEGMDITLGEDIPLTIGNLKIAVSREEFIEIGKQFVAARDEETRDKISDEINATLVYTDELLYPTIYCHQGSSIEAYVTEMSAIDPINFDIPYVLTHFFEGDWTYDYDNMIRYRKCIHCDELETEPLETTTDSDVEIIEPADPDTDFVVDVITDYVVIEEIISNNVAGDFEIVKAFDITMKNKDGVHVQPDGTVKVKLSLDWSKDGVYKVYRVNNDGTLTDMNAYRQGSHMVFETDHFSVYVIVDESEKADEPTTPDEPQEEAKKDLFSKIIDWFKSLIDLITSWFKK